MTEFSFWLFLVLTCYPFTLYPLSLVFLNLFMRKDYVSVDRNISASVSFVITAYNEESVIIKKLVNTLEMKHSCSFLEIIVASDASNDGTDELVKAFIDKFSSPALPIVLRRIEGRLGKTFVQNKIVEDLCTDIVVFSDANSIWLENSLQELISFFDDEKVGYVSGSLRYMNSNETPTSSSESAYWNFDLKIREMESNIGSTVGGNGAIYAVRRACYYCLPPVLSHDGFLPTKMVLNNYKAKYCSSAIAYEQASTDSSDEFSRKVRMQRGQPYKKYYDIQKFNFLQFGLFSYFYFGHKYLKYQLYIFHPLLLFLNILLASGSTVYSLILILHVQFYLNAFLCAIFNLKCRFFSWPYHYLMTVFAMWVSVYNTFSGKTSSVWEKSLSTRV